MRPTKALILTGQVGDDHSRLIAPGAPRVLFPVANRPILFHHLDVLRAAGIQEVMVLTGPGERLAFERALEDRAGLGIGVRRASWRPSEGVRGALASASAFIAGEAVVVQRGDVLLRDDLSPHAETLSVDALDALVLRTAPANGAPRPLDPPCWLLSGKAVETLLQGRANDGGSPFAALREAGGRVQIEDVRVLSCDGDDRTLLEVNRTLLDGLKPSVPDTLAHCVIEGSVRIHPTARVRHSRLRGPLVIGAGSSVTHAYVGPYTSIGENVTIEGAEIEHSIVLARAELSLVGTRLESSVIGCGARIVRGFGFPSGLSMSLGEGSEVMLG